MSNKFDKVRGWIGSIFQFGLGGPQVKRNGDNLDFRNADDTGYVNVRAKSPLLDDDLTTKKYVDSVEGILIISRQADTSASIPNNTAARGFVMITTAGFGGTVIGQLLFDNGLNDAQPMEIIAVKDGRTVHTTTALSGGTITFQTDSLYTWDANETGSWILSSDVGNLSGPLRIMEIDIDNSASQDGVASIPSNSKVYWTRLRVNNSYSAGTTISIGKPGSLSLLMATTENNPVQGSTPNTFVVEDEIEWGGSDAIPRITITNTPAVGDGKVLIAYSRPNN